MITKTSDRGRRNVTTTADHPRATMLPYYSPLERGCRRVLHAGSATESPMKPTGERKTVHRCLRPFRRALLPVEVHFLTRCHRRGMTALSRVCSIRQEKARPTYGEELGGKIILVWRDGFARRFGLLRRKRRSGVAQLCGTASNKPRKQAKARGTRFIARMRACHGDIAYRRGILATLSGGIPRELERHDG